MTLSGRGTSGWARMMTTKQKTTVFRIGLSSILLAVAGCGTIAGAANRDGGSSSPTAQWAPTHWSRETADQHYAKAGITLAPPAADLSPAYSFDQAYATCTSGIAPCPAGVPIVLLATFSDDEYGNIQSDGSVSHPFQNQLAWVFTWHDQSCLTPGPRTPSWITFTIVSCMDL